MARARQRGPMLWRGCLWALLALCIIVSSVATKVKTRKEITPSEEEEVDGRTIAVKAKPFSLTPKHTSCLTYHTRVFTSSYPASWSVYNKQGEPDYNVVQLEDNFLILQAGSKSGSLVITATSNCAEVEVGEPCASGQASATWDIVPRWEAAMILGIVIAIFLNLLVICTQRRIPAYCDVPAICDALGARALT